MYMHPILCDILFGAHEAAVSASISAKEPYTIAKEAYIIAKEHYVIAKEPYAFALYVYAPNSPRHSLWCT